MHRSGTSMTASLLQHLGVRMGKDFYSADQDNPRGYWEDTDFLEFNRRVLQECVGAETPGWPDWGWAESGPWRSPDPTFHLPSAVALISRFDKESSPWGWKDPRTTRLLDFWLEAAPAARFVFVYRPPWEVADSLQRIRPDLFRSRPHYAHPIWCDYNRNLLEFRRRHPERCVLLATNALVSNPNRLPQLLRSRFNLELPDLDLRPLVKPEEFACQTGENPLINLLSRAHPESLRILGELEAIADQPAGPELWRPAGRLRFVGPKSAKTNMSVVIPCYNQGEFLLEAVASVEAHAPDDTELLVVDDGSNEKRTRDILRTLSELGYRVLVQPNRGLSAARNAGIRATQAALILPLDADNRLRAGYLENARRILDEQPKSSVVYGDCLEFGAQNRRRIAGVFDSASHVLTPSVDACAVFRRQVWRDAKGYDESMRNWEDWDFWIKADSRGHAFSYWPYPGFDYRVREGSMCRQEMDPSGVRRRMEKLYDKHARHIRRLHRWAKSRTTYVNHVMLIFFPNYSPPPEEPAVTLLWRLGKIVRNLRSFALRPLTKRLSLR
jgi:glycosyltransferase involved in cell wall biosynthesis